MTRRAPVLSATSSTLCIWIITISNLNRWGGAGAFAPGANRFASAHRRRRRLVLEPVRVELPPTLRFGIARCSRDHHAVSPRLGHCCTWSEGIGHDSFRSATGNQQVGQESTLPASPRRFFLPGSDQLCLPQQTRPPPCLGLRQLAAGFDLDQVAFLV